jgi:hypothetical protein
MVERFHSLAAGSLSPAVRMRQEVPREAPGEVPTKTLIPGPLAQLAELRTFNP